MDGFTVPCANLDFLDRRFTSTNVNGGIRGRRPAPGVGLIKLARRERILNARHVTVARSMSKGATRGAQGRPKATKGWKLVKPKATQRPGRKSQRRLKGSRRSTQTKQPERTTTLTPLAISADKYSPEAALAVVALRVGISTEGLIVVCV